MCLKDNFSLFVHYGFTFLIKFAKKRQTLAEWLIKVKVSNVTFWLLEIKYLYNWDYLMRWLVNVACLFYILLTICYLLGFWKKVHIKLKTEKFDYNYKGL